MNLEIMIQYREFSIDMMQFLTYTFLKTAWMQTSPHWIQIQYKVSLLEEIELATG